MHPAELVATIAAAIAVSFYIGYAVFLGIEALIDVLVAWRQSRHQQKIARIKADLDQAQEELRHTILALAEQLAAERDEAARDLTRAAYLTSGTVTRVE